MFLGAPRACVGVFGWCGVSGSRVVVCALQVFPVSLLPKDRWGGGRLVRRRS